MPLGTSSSSGPTPTYIRAEGSTFQVNTYVTGSQFRPAVAADSSGNFVVVWHSASQDGSGYGVFGQRYDSAGSPQGGEFVVNTYTTGRQSSPAVATDPAGNFVVVWVDGDFLAAGQDGSGSGVVGQRYDSTGVPVGGEFAVNTYTTGHQTLPVVAVDGSGNFVVAWKDDGGQDGSLGGVFGQRYDGAGTRLGTEFQVNTYTTSTQYLPSVAADASGTFVVVWYSVGDGSDRGVFGQVFDGTGAAKGGEFQVNTYTTDRQLFPAVAMLRRGGDFVVVWQSLRSGSTEIFGQRFAGACGDGVIDPGEACDDGNIIERDGCDGACQVAACYTCGGEPSVCTFSPACAVGVGACTVVPLPDCRQPTSDRKSSFVLKNKAPDSKDRLAWRWKPGAETELADFGDPLTTTDYALCLYDASTTSQPVLEALAPAGGTCDGQPCWKEKGEKGFDYRDKGLDPDGLQRIALRAGVDGKARVLVRGKGVNLPMPQLPLKAPVIVQLQASNGACWEAEYGGRFVVQNEERGFRAKAGLGCSPQLRLRSPSRAFVDVTASVLD
jgi:cysteine-rich repeat protein